MCSASGAPFPELSVRYNSGDSRTRSGMRVDRRAPFAFSGVMLPRECLFISLKAGRIRRAVANKVFQHRASAMLGLMADVSGTASLPDQKFIINLADRPTSKRYWHFRTFGAATADGAKDIAAPDFVFGGWPEAGVPDFDGAAALIRDAAQQPPQTDLLGWRGNANNVGPRQALLDVSNANANLVEAIDTGDWYTRGHRLDGSASELMTMPDQVRRYRYLLDVEGVGYSGRLKLLLHAGRPVFVQQRPWQEWYFPMLQPWKHFVPVARNCSDLLVNLKALRADPNLAAQIGKAGQQFATQYLTRSNAIDVWRTLLAG